jgi:isocitrate dehydrogenase kinase/phosphatase
LSNETQSEKEKSISSSKNSKEKEDLYSKPFFKSNFRFFEKRVKADALLVLRKRKKTRKLKTIQKKLAKAFGKSDEKGQRLDSVLDKIFKSRKIVKRGTFLVEQLERNLKMIEKELVEMKTSD